MKFSLSLYTAMFYFSCERVAVNTFPAVFIDLYFYHARSTDFEEKGEGL